VARPTCTLTCSGCGLNFIRLQSVVSAMRRRNPEVTLSCSKGCKDFLWQRQVTIQDSQVFEYLLGVVLGDGCVGDRAVRVAVGIQDRAYAEMLVHLFGQGVGAVPSVLCHEQARAFYVNLSFTAAARLFAPFKVNSLWVLDGLQHPEQVLAGICDTDGGWETKKGRRTAFCISQKDNGNLERTLPLWRALGLQPSLKHYAIDRAVLRVPAGQLARFLAVVPLRHPRKCPLNVQDFSEVA
jgi:hypothetical protein